MSENLLQQHEIKSEHIEIMKEILGKNELSLNPMQVDFIQNGFLEKDKVVILAPTASGKTLLIHLKYAKNLEAGRKRMAYLSHARQ
jgi:superfamily II helicase